MGQRAVEPAARAEADQAGDTVDRRAALPELAGTAVTPDHGVWMSPLLEGLDRLGQGARGELDLVTAALEALDQRAQHEHVGGVGEVDPHSHGRRCYFRASRPPGAR